MAETAEKRLEVDELLSFADELILLVDGSKYGEAVAQVGAGARMLRSVCGSELSNVELQQKEYQEKIRSCKEKIDKVKAETIADDELKAQRSKMEEKLQEEKQLRQDLRAIHDELDKLDRQRVSIEERKIAIKKMEKDMWKAQKTLSMLTSVTKIVPKLEDQDKISGYICDKYKKKIEAFEFEKTTSPVEICNELWKKI